MNKIERMLQELCPNGVEYKKLGDVCEIKGRIGFRGYTRKDLVSENEGACLVLKKVDSQQSHIMYYLQTEKQRKYFKETIRLHYERGYGEDRIARILPIGHATVSRWIAIFEREKGNVFGMQSDGKSQPHPAPAESDVKALQSRIKELEKRLRMAEIKAEAYDEMINVAEAKFKIPIRKKAGAKR